MPAHDPSAARPRCGAVAIDNVNVPSGLAIVCEYSSRNDATSTAVPVDMAFANAACSGSATDEPAVTPAAAPPGTTPTARDAPTGDATAPPGTNTPAPTTNATTATSPRPTQRLTMSPARRFLDVTDADRCVRSAHDQGSPWRSEAVSGLDPGQIPDRPDGAVRSL